MMSRCFFPKIMKSIFASIEAEMRPSKSHWTFCFITHMHLVFFFGFQRRSHNLISAYKKKSISFSSQISNKSIYCDKHTLFKNHSKCRIWIFQLLHFPPIFVLIKLTCLVTLFDRKLQVFKNSLKWTILGTFNHLLSTQNVNVARFARNVEWDFFCDFQTPCEKEDV